MICITLLYCTRSPAQSLSYVGIDQGLSNNAVRCIFQDHKGFLWFGTFDGLNRYDGYSFKVFRNKINDTSSLGNNYIFSIAEDRESNMWVGTHEGASIYNNLSGNFSAVYYMDHNNTPKKRITVGVRIVKAELGGGMLLGTLGVGLLVKDQKAAVAKQIPIKTALGDIWNYDVQAIKSDIAGNTWVFVPQVGLCLLNRDRGKLTILTDAIRNAFCIEPSKDGKIWIGTADGVFRYDRHFGKTEKILDKNTGLSLNTVADMVFDHNGLLWLAINGAGVNKYDTTTRKVTYLKKENGSSALSNDAAYCIYQDKDSRVWVGELYGGINIINPQPDRFKTMAHDPSNPHSLPNKPIYALYEDINHDLWIGTDGGGILVWNKNQSNLRAYDHEEGNPRSLSDNIVSTITGDNEGNIWVGTFFNGVNRFNRSANSFQHYRCINPLSLIENKTISTICKDKNDDIWIGTHKGNGINGALYLLDKTRDQFKAFDTNLSDIFTLKPDNEGRLWAGMLTQLVQIDRKNRRHKFSDLGYYIRVIYEDREKRFWIGTEGGGLVLFDRDNSRIAARYSTENGLCNNSVLNIQEDDKGDLWLSTFYGLSKFDPVAKIFKNYYKSDGLQSNQFHYNSSVRLSSGELVFGGISGLSRFFPKKIVDLTGEPELVLSGIAVNNTVLEKNSSLVKQYTPDEIKKIEVPYNQAVIALDFAALEYTAPDKIRYAYMMENWDHNWTYSGNIRTANYTHLDAGNYIFRVKCTNAGGSWSKQEVALNIHILPPWYRTWWAYILYLAFVVAAIYGYIFYHQKQTELRYEVKLVEEVNEKKIAFFTNISHELRAPLTLIVNPIKYLLQNNGANLDLIDISSIYRNSRRLLSLVDQLLLFRSSENEVSALNPAPLNLKEVCYEVFLCFNNQVKSNDIDYQFLAPDNAITIWADREKLEIILFNLISNAIKFTPKNGAVMVTIAVSAKNAEILVSDTGCGIPEDTGQKLFEKFYRLPHETETVEKSGFGIGLFLAKKFVDLHHGEISYSGVENKGTTFKIILPLAHENLVNSVNNHYISKTLPLIKEIITDGDNDNFRGESSEKKHVEEILDGVVNKRPIILIIDDDAEMRNYIKHLLRDAFIISEAGNTEKGLEIILENEPDIIVCDVIMNGTTGVEFCSTMKDSPSFSHIPIILLTGSSSPEIKLKGIECGADDYITKPFESDLLIARIKSLLKGRTILKDYFFNEITLKNNSLKIPAEYSDFLSRCIAIIEDHLDDEQFSIKTFTEEIGMSRAKLFRKIKSISGLSNSEFVRYIRLRKAAELMISTDLQIKEVAYRIGIQDVRYFREQFHKLFEMNPSEFIRKYRKAFISNLNLNGNLALKKNKQ
nr:hybrid sensor histidine kinase/response regulator transcription factor [Mucilaginibacter sp. X5P1]